MPIIACLHANHSMSACQSWHVCIPTIACFTTNHPDPDTSSIAAPPSLCPQPASLPRRAAPLHAAGHSPGGGAQPSRPASVASAARPGWRACPLCPTQHTPRGGLKAAAHTHTASAHRREAPRPARRRLQALHRATRPRAAVSGSLTAARAESATLQQRGHPFL
jgi:hypothetical protein